MGRERELCRRIFTLRGRVTLIGADKWWIEGVLDGRMADLPIIKRPRGRFQEILTMNGISWSNNDAWARRSPWDLMGYI